MEAYQTEEYRGFELRVEYDPEPANPREEYCNVATFVCEHRRYKLGDEHNVESAINELYVKYIGDPYELSLNEQVGALIASHKVVIRTIGMYDHGGVSIYLDSDMCPNCYHQWDCGILGFAYIEEDTAYEQRLGNLKDWENWANQVIEGEMEIYNAYLTGEVFGRVIENLDNSGDGDSSCWGYYGTSQIDHMVECMKDEVDEYIESQEAERKQNIKFLNENLEKLNGSMFYYDRKLYRINGEFHNYFEVGDAANGIFEIDTLINFRTAPRYVLQKFVDYVTKITKHEDI